MRPHQGLLAGLLVPAGWILHDAAVFAHWPTFLRLLPGSAVALCTGAVLGAVMAGRPRLVLLLGALSALASLAPLALGPLGPLGPIGIAARWAPRAMLMFTVAWVGTGWLHRRLAVGLVRAGLGIGVLVCLAKTLARIGMFSAFWPISIGLALAALTARGKAATRVAGAIASLLAPVIWLDAVSLPEYQPSRADLAPPTLKPHPGAPNLLLVVLDTVRADHLAPYGYTRVTTPRLDRYVDEHFTRYANARSTSPWTLPSHGSLFTGLLPAQHKASLPDSFAVPIGEDVLTLAERLREHGYLTASIPANLTWLNHRYGLTRGFEFFDDSKQFWDPSYLALAQLTGWNIRYRVPYRDASRISDLALDWLDKKRAGPFFLFLNYFDAHKPYLPPNRFGRVFKDERPSNPSKPPESMYPLLYDREIAYLDERLDVVLRRLEALDAFENTVIVITSDHGEGLGDHNLLYHGIQLFDSLIHVPLYIKPAGQRLKRVDTTQVSGADVHDLMLELLDQEPTGNAERPFVSEFYLGSPEHAHLEQRDQDWFALISWMQGTRKYIVRTDGRVDAYDIEIDPGELEALPLSQAETQAALEKARAWWRAHPIEPRDEVEVDELTIKRMRELGYGF